MPAEVIATVHQLAIACKKYKGITFTDKDGNIIKDDEDKDDVTGNSRDDTKVNSEITGVDGDDGNDNETSQITGVPQTNLEGNSHENEGNISYDDEGNDKGNTNNIEDSPPEDGVFPSQHEGNINDSEENGPGNTHKMDDDKISIKTDQLMTHE